MFFMLHYFNLVTISFCKSCILSENNKDMFWEFWQSPVQMVLCFSQTPEELEDDSDFEQEDYDTRSRTSVQTEDDQLIAGQSARVRWYSLAEMLHTWNVTVN